MDVPVLFNDPYPAAFLVAAGYLVVSVLCLRARTLGSGGSIRVFWGIMGALLFVFGVNKQLNLHQILLEHARNSSALLLAMAVLAACAAAGAVVFAARLVRKPAPGVRPTLAATVVLLVFLGVKMGGPKEMSAFVNMDLTTDKEDFLHIHLIEVIQMGVLVVIGTAAWKAGRRVRRGMQSTRVDRH